MDLLTLVIIVALAYYLYQCQKGKSSSSLVTSATPMTSSTTYSPSQPSGMYGGAVRVGGYTPRTGGRLSVGPAQ